MIVLPQPSVPFTILPDGSTAVNEQDSTEDHAAQIYNVAICPEGFRDDLPEYGIPPETWRTIPLDLTGLEDALHRWVPDATLELAQHRAAVGQAQIAIAVE